MNMPHREKIRLIVFSSMGLLLSLLFILGSIHDHMNNDGFIMDLLVRQTIGWIIGGYTARYAKGTIDNFRKGLPRVDELTQRVRGKAATSTFFLWIYLDLILLFSIDEGSVDAKDFLFAQILGMVIIYGFCRLWYNHYGDLTDDGGV